MVSKQKEELKTKADALNGLMQEREDLSVYIKELTMIYKIDPSLFTPEIWLGLINVSEAKSDSDSMLGILALRDKLRDEHSAEAEKLKRLNAQIFLNNIDLILDKIKLLQKDLELTE